MGPDGKEEIKKTSHLTENEFLFHATMIYASGGMVLAGDDITQMSDQNIAMLKKLLPPTNVSAQFDDSSFQIGRIEYKDSLILCLFNWDEQKKDLEVDLPGRYYVKDMWANKELGEYEEKLMVNDMPAHSGKILICENY